MILLLLIELLFSSVQCCAVIVVIFPNLFSPPQRVPQVGLLCGGRRVKGEEEGEVSHGRAEL